MSSDQALSIAAIALVATVPVAVVVIVALVRGYTIHVTMHRPPHAGRRRRRKD
jgi:hypothetical protein